MTPPTLQPNTNKQIERQPQRQNKQDISSPTPSITPSINPLSGVGHVQRENRAMNPSSILQLQSRIGNHAVGSMLGVNKTSAPRPREGVIQRTFDGELSGKSTEDIVGLLESAGYTVNGITKVKLATLRDGQTSYTDINAIAKTLNLRSKSQPSGVSVESGGSKESSESSKSEGSGGFGLPKKKVSESGPSSLGIGGGTTWMPAPSPIKVEAKASEGQPPQPFGQLSLKYNFTVSGLDFTADLFSNPKLIWEKGDKVSIMLQMKNGSSHLIGDLRVQKTGNIIELKGKATFAALANILRIPVPTGKVEEKREKLAGASAQMGLLAMWRTKEDVGEQHRSGGIDQKGGSGLINVSAVPVNETTLKKTEDEDIRNVGWNESQIATEERPLVKSFPNLIKLGEEIATTLEAESEYMVPKEGYESILNAMAKISGSDKKELLEEYGIEKEVNPSVKNYVDTYYDLDTGDESGLGLPLLERNIVFRHRSVPKELNNGEGDPEGTNLIAIKGRSVTDEGEAIRLASQFQAKYDLLREDKQEEVLNFLRSEQVDNPFARILQDALGEDKGILKEATKLKKALIVKSKRTKYKLWLANSTMIDLSVDEATGEMDGYPKHEDHVVYSFEFGVGHPGLSAGATGSSGLSEEDPKLEQLREELAQYKDKESSNMKVVKSNQIQNRLEKTNRLVHRPYHVPKDLENKKLFAKGDYTQYKNLRDTLISRLFGMEKTELERGGNKAKLLAQKIKSTDSL